MNKQYLVLNWILSIIFIGSGFVSITTIPLQGLVFLIAGLILLPPLRDFLGKKTKITIPRNVRVVSIVVLFLVAANIDDPNYEKRIEEEKAVAARLEQERIAEIKSIAEERIKIKTDKFRTNKANILTELRSLVKNKNYAAANSIVTKYIGVKDAEFVKISREVQTQRLLAQLKNVDPKDDRTLAGIYGSLATLHPNNMDYNSKHDEHSAKLIRKAAWEKAKKTQFSGFDGSHYKLTKFIKSSMKDPDSYKHVDTVYWEKEDHFLVRTKFRGKNSFGALVINTITVKTDVDGDIIQVVSQK